MNSLRTVLPLLLALLTGACGHRRPSSDDAGVPPGTDAGVATVSCPEAEEAAVVTESGCVRGREEGSAVVFRGIPYAQPPLGALRWAPPVPAQRWSGVREAAAFSKACPQLNALISGETLAWDEDCLYLNVWTPELSSTSRRPVMVWIHGGGLQNGAASQPTYDGRFLAQRGVVLVSINYRLSQLGYLAHPALSAEQGGRSGNYGLLDQLRALEWVRDNVARFGGDPANVTVFGESAGGLSVCGLLATPRAKGLFARAMVQSAVCPKPGSQFVRPLKASTGQGESAEEQGRRVSAALGCPVGADELACMRAKSPLEVMKALQALSGYVGAGERYAFAVDGVLLPVTPFEALEAGTAVRVPVIFGTTGNEASIFTQDISITTEAQYRTAVRAFYGASVEDELLALYPVASYPTPKAAFNALVSDVGTVCGVRRSARAAAATGVPVWEYQFTHVPAVAKLLGLGAYHSSELEFVFGTLRDRANSPATAAELALSDAMAAYWTSFATGGVPGTAAGVEWRPFTASGDASLDLNLAVSMQTGLRKQACDAADRLGLGN